MAYPTVFTKEKQAEFIDILRETGNKSRACREIGICYSTYRKHFMKNPEFQAASEYALEEFADKIDGEIYRRGFEGVDEPVFQMGQLIGHKRVYSDRLLMAMARAAKPDKYGEKRQVEVSGTVTHEHAVKAKDSISKKLDKALANRPAIDSVAIDVTDEQSDSLSPGSGESSL